MTDEAELLHVASDQLQAQLDALTRQVVDGIRRMGIGKELIDEPGLTARVVTETRAVIRELITALAHDGEPLRLPETRHVARLAARNGTPERDLLDAYRTGHRVLEEALIEAVPTAADAGVALGAVRLGARRLFAEIEHLGELAIAEYREELTAIRPARGRRQLHAVREVLRGEGAASLDFYNLRSDHLALAASGPGSERVVRMLMRGVNAPHCAVWPDAELGWVWIATSRADAVAAAADAAAESGCWIGMGEPARGAEGFRQSHAEARMALRVAEHQRRPVLRFSASAPEAIALADVEATRTLIRRQLGRLARPTRQAATARKTLSTYLGCGSNARETARRLHVSSRAVAYRLRQAGDLLPPGTDAGSLETALALRLFESLGAVDATVPDQQR
ncbi:PucR family transcriptional regulator [Streptomyces sp. LE64]|uniref:PucR family transcriptional regulator n=1 Tax=Streptomyces sp. LE64 TaxID=3448653 RepID=UPI0040425A59